MNCHPAKLAALSLLALALAGCGQKDTVEAKNESVASVNEKVANSDLRMKPGKWESRLAIESLEMPGMTAEMTAEMRKSMGMARVFATCITPQQVEKPSSDLFQQAAQGCKYDSFTMADGKIDARMSCSGATGPGTMTMSGTYGPEAYKVTMATQGKGDENLAMNMKMTIESKRVGDCEATGG